MSHEGRVLELLEQWEELRNQGKDLSLEVLCADCPELLGELTEGVQRLRQADQLLSPDAEESPASTVDRRTPPKDDGARDLISTSPAAAKGASEALPVPNFVGKYRVIEKLGEGGQAEVFRAMDPMLKRDVVIKWAKRKLPAPLQQQLLYEGQALARLEDHGLAKVYEAGVHEGRPFLVMEHIAGRTLRERLQQRRPAPREAAALIAQIAGTLARVHGQGVLHRDLKPANILIDADNRPRVLDFGLALMSQPWAAQSQANGAVCGTYSYMAPEQAEGQTERIGPGTDVFGLGAVLYETLTGRPPYQAPNALAVWEQARQGKVVPPHQLDPRVPRTLERICLKALAEEPQRRYTSAAEMEQALRAYLRRPRLWAALAVCVTVLLVAGLGRWLLWDQAKRTPLLPEPKGFVDVWIQEPGNLERHNLRLSQKGALPVKAGDLIRFEAHLDRPAYLYLVAIDTEGKAQPIYPWKQGDWNERPTEEKPAAQLRVPEAPDAWGQVTAGPPGMETMLLLVRNDPLPPDVPVAACFAELPVPAAQNPLAAVWFENGVLVRNEVERAVSFFDSKRSEDPVLRTQALLRERLQAHFRYTRAVSFANLGK